MVGRADRAALWLAVGLLHALLFLALRDAVLPRQRDVPASFASAPVPVRLILPSPPSPAATAAARALVADPLEIPLASTRAPRSQPHAAPIAPVAPFARTAQAITQMQAAIEPPPAASAPIARPLDLAIPRALAVPARPSMRDQMLNDPRANSPKASVETRVAAVAGTPELVEEPMDATRLRIKQNGQCIEVHVSRNAQIDQWNQSHLPTSKIVKPTC